MTPLKKYLRAKKCRWKFVELANHRVNASERAIQTLKNHFISGLCSTDSQWPTQLWDKLANQAATKLKILRRSRIDPTKLAFHQLNGHKYDWNAFTMAPPGTRAVIYISVEGHTSWGTRGIDVWYCGPSMDQYRNCILFIPETGSYRISGSFDLFSQHCLLPEFTPIQHTREVLAELTESVQKLNQ